MRREMAWMFGSPARAPDGVGRGVSLAGARFLAIVLAAMVAIGGLALALDVPKLDGRIVDEAKIIPEPVRAALADKLEALEAKSGIQFVVATVTSLRGNEIEPYANALFRAWGLGEKTKNNGVLLLVAPKQRKVRIEVGYGLEGTLTDALSKIIIANAMTPRFKAGDFGGGIERGIDDVITVLTTDSSEWEKRPDLRLDRHETKADNWAPWIAFALFLIIVFLLMRTPRRAPDFRFGATQPRVSRRGPVPRGAGGRGWITRQEVARPEGARPADRSGLGDLIWFLIGVLSSSRRDGGGWGSGSGGFGGGSDDGFSGGGGSSGGGGASGSW